jgi:hypothetical protein
MELMEEQDLDEVTALELLQSIYRSPGVSISMRMRAASLALPFEAPKLSAMALTSMTSHDFAIALDKAIERSGKKSEMRVIEHQTPETRLVEPATRPVEPDQNVECD